MMPDGSMMGDGSAEVGSIGPSLVGRPIDRLRPNSPEHTKVLEHVKKRLLESERQMSQFYTRWNVLERQIQAYITLPDWEKTLKEMNDKGATPRAVSIVIPYTYATIATVVTYHMQVFGGHSPYMQVGSNKNETMQSSTNMEQVLQYNCDHNRFLRWLWQFLQDSQSYGVGIFLNRWKIEKAYRTRRETTNQTDSFGTPLPSQIVRSRKLETLYEGNEVNTIDPFMFFPDPRVPMVEVAERGEYVFWRSYEGRHSVKREESDGNFKWVDAAGIQLPANEGSGAGGSVRSLMALGESHPGMRYERQS